MKLYATTTSERASKGQGGNVYLHIEIATGTAKDSHKMADIMVDAHGFLYIRQGDKTELATYVMSGGKLHDVTGVNKTKGKSQKGEYVCKKCGKSAKKGTREQQRDFVFSDICIGCNK